MSFTPFAREDVTVWDGRVAGVDASCEMMESSETPSKVVASEEDNEEDGMDVDGMKYAAAVLLGAMGAANEGMVIFEMGAGDGSTDATLQIDSGSQTL